jgi:hypothetical protein
LRAKTAPRAEQACHNPIRNEEITMDFPNAKLTDVPEIVSMIKALRKVTEETGTITKSTQSYILRNIPPNVLIAVAQELDRPTFKQVLSGDVVEAGR